MTDLAVHLTGPGARAALARRDIPAVYRILCETGVTQARIGQATGQKPSEVSEILAGRRVKSIGLLERIADGLGVPRGWMGLSYAPALAPEPAATMETEQQCTANLLRHGATVLFGAPVFGPAQRIAASATPTPVPDRIGLAGAGLRDRARQHYLRGMDCARAAGDLVRAMVNLDKLGYLELYIAPNDALKFFQLGAATISTAPLLRQQVWWTRRATPWGAR